MEKKKRRASWTLNRPKVATRVCSGLWQYRLSAVDFQTGRASMDKNALKRISGLYVLADGRGYSLCGSESSTQRWGR